MPSPRASRLPSVRELMARHRASPVTVQRAIARLAGEGLVEPRPGRGTFVAAPAAPATARRRRRPTSRWQAVALGAAARRRRRAQRAARACRPPGAIPLSTRLPRPRAAAARRRSARRSAARRAAPGAWDRGPVEGREELRAWFAREAGGGLRAHDMVVCPGGQSALATAFRALAAPGEPILVESPTYVGALAAARAAGLRVVPVADRRRRRAARRCWPRRFERSGARRPLLPAAVRQPARRDARRRPPRRGARRRRGRGRVPGRGRLGAATWRSTATPPPPLAAADRRRPRRLRALADQVRRRPGCASRRSARAARPARGCAPRASSTTSSCPGRCRRRRSSSSPRPPGGGTCARCAARCASAATRSPPRSSASSRRCG